jgi:hypothetical protein
MPTEEEIKQMAADKMYRNVVEYLPGKQPDADRVKELHYTSNQEGFFDRTIVNDQNQVIGVERTPGDVPQTLKDDYYWLINKNYALGVVDTKDKQIDDINVRIGLILYNAQHSKQQRTIKEAAEQHYAMMIHESEITMATGGFNRQVASTITQVQGQFFKMGKSMKDAARSMYDELRGQGE